MDSKVEIVISGIGGYYPRSVNLDDYAELLMKNEKISDPALWNAADLNVNENIGKVDQWNSFDASFFGIHKKLAVCADPMQRMLLEATFSAVIDAGINPSEIHGKKIGVYMNNSIPENDFFLYDWTENGFAIMGNNRAMMANRVSYWLQLTGPSCTYDSNWNGSVQILKQAMKAIETGQCDAAVVGSSNLTRHAYISWIFKAMGLISDEDFTRVFDKEACGYSRSDGIVVLYLQNAKYAKRSYCTLLKANVSIDGENQGRITDVDPRGLIKFLSNFYEESGVKPDDVKYMEAYGCGIKSVDEKELNAIDEVLCKKRSSPLLIGSVKSNSGHAESCSVMMSLAKCIITSETGIIPATINCRNPNPNIRALVDGRIQIVRENTKFDGGIVAINCIGMICQYGHVLLKMNDKPKRNYKIDIPLLTVFSTRKESDVKEMIAKQKVQPIDFEYSMLANKVFSTNLPSHMYRGYILKNIPEVSANSAHYACIKRPIWFVYSGMGSQWETMGKDLMQLPIFARAIEKCHAILEPKGVDLKNIITADDPTLFDNILNSFVGIAAIQIGLTDVLKAIGIVPDGIIGHSVGEFGCAYGDGCLTAEEMITSSYYRGKASLESSTIRGMMAAIGLGYNQIKNFLPPSIEVACRNGPDSCTISGPVEDVKQFVAVLKSRDIFAKMVNVANIAYHSRYIKPIGPLLYNYVKDVIKPKPRSPRWISTSIKDTEWQSDLAKMSSAEYHTNNLLSPVLFEEGLKYIPQNAILIEIAPHGLLQAILKRSLPLNCTNISLTKRKTGNQLQFLFNALGQLYLNGAEFDLAPLYPKIEYPVSRGTRSLGQLVGWEHGEEWDMKLHKAFMFSSNEKNINITLNNIKFRHLENYKVNGKNFIPPIAYLKFLYEMLCEKMNLSNVIFSNISIHRNLVIQELDSRPVHLMYQIATGRFEASFNNEVVMSGFLNVPEDVNKSLRREKLNVGDSYVKIDRDDFYKEMKHRGYDFRKMFRNVASVINNEAGTVGLVGFSEWETFVTAMIQLKMFYEGSYKQTTVIPYYIEKLVISFDNLPKPGEEAEVVCNYDTGAVSTCGVTMCGVHFKTLPPPVTNVDVIDRKSKSKSIENGFREEDGNFMRTLVISKSLILKCKVNYLGINTICTDMNDVQHVDYSGLDSSQKRIMGIARRNITENQITYDPEFVWEIPSKWSTLDATTVPYAYTMAYYVLYHLLKLLKGETVLINADCSPFAQALASVALCNDCPVFMTVANDQQKTFMKSFLPKLNEKHILSSQNCHFATQVKYMTNGVGVHVIVNCLPSKFCAAAKSCLALNGRLAHLNKSDMESGTTVGTRTFLKSTTMYGVNPETIVNHTVEVKKKLRDLVQKGIESGTVVPLQRTLYKEDMMSPLMTRYMNSNQGSAVVEVNAEQILNDIEARRKFKFDSDAAYLIYGNDPESWVDVVEWAISKGARRVMVGPVTQKLDNYVNHRLMLLEYYSGAEIMLSNKRANTIETAKNLLSDAEVLGTLNGVIMLPKKSSKDTAEVVDFELVKNMDLALGSINPKAHLICLVGNDAAKSYDRKSSRSMFNINWDKSVHLSDVLSTLGDLVINKENADVFIKRKQADLGVVKSDGNSGLVSTIPVSLESMKMSATYLPMTTDFVRFSSNFPRNFKYQTPIFVIPGLTDMFCSNLKKFFGNLMYPVYCASLSQDLNENPASILAKKMLQIDDKGVFNIVGISWGGALAIEVAKILEKSNVRVQLLLIDGAPDTVQNYIKSHRDIDAFKNDLVRKMREIIGSETTTHGSMNGEHRYKKLLHSDRVKQQVTERLIRLVERQIQVFNLYKSSTDDLISAKTVLFRPKNCSLQDDCGLAKYCKEFTIKLSEEQPFSMLADKVLIEFLNDNVDIAVQ